MKEKNPGITKTLLVIESVSDPFEEVSLPEPPPPLSLLPHEIMVRLKKDTNNMCKILLIFFPPSPSVMKEDNLSSYIFKILQKRLKNTPGHTSTFFNLSIYLN